MKQLIMMKRMGGGLLAVLTATSIQVAHAGTYGPAVKHIVEGDGSAKADLMGLGHKHLGVTTPNLPPGDYPDSHEQFFPENKSEIEYTFDWVPDGPDDNGVPGPRKVESKLSVSGGPLKATHNRTGSRAEAWASLAPASEGFRVDTINGSPSEARVRIPSPTYSWTQDPDPMLRRIRVVVVIRGAGYSYLTAVRNGEAETQFNGLAITDAGVTMPPKPVIIREPPPGEEGRL